jgi:hypothetical protein
MRGVSFEGCQFLDVDLRGTTFENCEAASSEFDGITLDSTSQIGISGLRPGVNIKRVHHDPPGDVYAPAAITELLKELGAPEIREPKGQPEYSDHAQALIDLLQRVARAYQRATIIYASDNRRYHAILDSPHWPELKSLLIKHGVIVEEEREAKGANVVGYRLRANPDELLTGDVVEDPSSTSKLWGALAVA